MVDSEAVIVGWVNSEMTGREAELLSASSCNRRGEVSKSSGMWIKESSGGHRISSELPDMFHASQRVSDNSVKNEYPLKFKNNYREGSELAPLSISSMTSKVTWR
jgi:hypothetical protein